MVSVTGTSEDQAAGALAKFATGFPLASKKGVAGGPAVATATLATVGANARAAGAGLLVIVFLPFFFIPNPIRILVLLITCT
jgi:hypothetical protein